MMKQDVFQFIEDGLVAASHLLKNAISLDGRWIRQREEWMQDYESYLQSENDYGLTPNIKAEDWSSEFPREEGMYWFYGDPSYGSMGAHYKEEDPMPPDIEMKLVHVIRIANGTIGIVDGRHMTDLPFCREIKREGYVGYFAKAYLPEEPEDSENLFS